MVTGSLLGRGPPASRKTGTFGAFAAPRASTEAVHPESAGRAFLSRLQSAVSAGDRRAIVRLIGFPLRVNFNSGSRTYRDASSVERDFDRIFTPKVTSAILAQRADRLFVRDQGLMIGDGEVWFSATCPDAECDPSGPIRITAINP